MKERSCIVLAIVAILVGIQPALAQYESIQHNLFDGITDLQFQGGKLIIDSNSNLITLNDSGAPLPGTISNAHIHIETTFDHFDPLLGSSGNGSGVFSGGNIALTFNYDGTPHEISGPIAGMLLEVGYAMPTLSRVDGQGLFTATTKDLPGSGMWNDGGGMSSIKSMHLFLGTDLTGWRWQQDTSHNLVVDSQVQLFPNDTAVPEASTIVLLLGGIFGLLRRRKA